MSSVITVQPLLYSTPSSPQLYSTPPQIHRHFALTLLYLNWSGTPIRVTHIAPGLVSNTEFSIVRLAGDKDKAEAVYSGIEALQPEDVADNVLYAVTRPPHVRYRNLILNL